MPLFDHPVAKLLSMVLDGISGEALPLAVAAETGRLVLQSEDGGGGGGVVTSPNTFISDILTQSL